jgi:hypothetical protein
MLDNEEFQQAMLSNLEGKNFEEAFSRSFRMSMDVACEGFADKLRKNQRLFDVMN